MSRLVLQAATEVPCSLPLGLGDPGEAYVLGKGFAQGFGCSELLCSDHGNSPRSGGRLESLDVVGREIFACVAVFENVLDALAVHVHPVIRTAWQEILLDGVAERLLRVAEGGSGHG